MRSTFIHLANMAQYAQGQSGSDNGCTQTHRWRTGEYKCHGENQAGVWKRVGLLYMDAQGRSHLSCEEVRRLRH